MENASHTKRYPVTNAALRARNPPLAARRAMRSNSRTAGVTEGVIMPTIITSHIANVSA
jgi:hypothetical protein